jgi:dTDP-4-dehydrorhamnose 3,5-epimerase
LRGFHYQIGKYSEIKIIKCLKGKIYDIIVDLRKKSPTYKKFICVRLDDKNDKSILFPKGCANAFLTLESNTLVIYYTNNYYNKSSERGLRYNDSNFNFNWPKKPKIISKKDLSYKNFKD